MRIIWTKLQSHVMLAVGCIMLVASGMYYFKYPNREPVSTATVAAIRADIAETVAATGTISPLNSVEISSRVTGLITEVKVQENDYVKAGQVLLVLDDSSLKAQVAQHYSQLLNYRAIYERSQKLAAAGALAEQELDTDRTNYLVAQSTYDKLCFSAGLLCN